MPPRLKAPIEPALLIWARNSAALSLDAAAKKIGVSVERIQAWEAGNDLPTIPQLKKVAAAYKRPLAVLFLSAPPNELGFDAIRDFRRIDPNLGQAFSPQLAYEVRAAIERRMIALDVSEALGQPPAEFSWRATITDDPETVAAAVRAHLGLRLEDQYRWHDARKAFKIWRDAFENAGVLVFLLSGAHHQVPLGMVRGFAIAEQPFPVVVVNGKDRPGGRLFTLLHEIGHIVLGQTAIDNELSVESQLPAPLRTVETFCNRFAAAALMPREAILNDSLVSPHLGRYEWSNEELGTLATRYSVSREAMLLRLVELGRAHSNLFFRKKAEYAAQYAEEDANAEDDGGFAPHRYQVLGHLGRTFSQIVLQGYYQKHISLSTASGYLGVKTKQVPGISEVAFARTA